jgi:hypothetical protein
VELAARVNPVVSAEWVELAVRANPVESAEWVELAARVNPVVSAEWVELAAEWVELVARATVPALCQPVVQAEAATSAAATYRRVRDMVLAEVP